LWQSIHAFGDLDVYITFVNKLPKVVQFDDFVRNDADWDLDVFFVG
jgi:hypothetical protein